MTLTLHQCITAVLSKSYKGGFANGSAFDSAEAPVDFFRYAMKNTRAATGTRVSEDISIVVNRSPENYPYDNVDVLNATVGGGSRHYTDKFRLNGDRRETLNAKIQALGGNLGTAICSHDTTAGGRTMRVMVTDLGWEIMLAGPHKVYDVLLLGVRHLIDHFLKAQDGGVNQAVPKTVPVGLIRTAVENEGDGKGAALV